MRAPWRPSAFGGATIGAVQRRPRSSPAPCPSFFAAAITASADDERRDLVAQPLVAQLFVRAFLREPVERERRLRGEHVERDEREHRRDRDERRAPHRAAGRADAAGARPRARRSSRAARRRRGRGRPGRGVACAVGRDRGDGCALMGDLRPRCRERRTQPASRSTARRRALSARGFAATSSADGRSGLPVSTRTSARRRGGGTGQLGGQRRGRRRRRPSGRTSLSPCGPRASGTRARARGPAGRSTCTDSSSPSARFGSSRFTSMRIAWNVRRAGCGPRRRVAAGIASRTIVGELARRAHRAGRDDRAGDAAGEALFAVLRDDGRELRLRRNRSRRRSRSATASRPSACRAARRTGTRSLARAGRAAGCSLRDP